MGWIGDRSKELDRRTMKVEKLIACLLAEIRTNQAKAEGNQTKADGNVKEIKEVI
jgi:hypothetical protein